MEKTTESPMKEAIRLAKQGLDANAGGPFGCVVVKDGVIVGKGSNRVTSTNDPTAHAEVVAIRDACRHLNTFQLDGCEVYTNCEPCPMCLGAIYWARPSKVYFANTRYQAADAGFDDAFIYDEIVLDPAARRIPMIHTPDDEAMQVFRDWIAKPDKTLY
jgi:tRNA(Arg) A34 adenosine deaminase TadA